MPAIRMRWQPTSLNLKLPGLVKLSTSSLLALLLLLPAMEGCRKRRPVEPAPDGTHAAAVESPPATPGKTPEGPSSAKVVFATPETLAAYTVQLRDWVKRASYVPGDLAQLKSAVGAPPLPKVAPGQTLIYDPKTITVRLQ